MALSLFGLTHSDVKEHFFPSLNAFSASTKPTSTAVGAMIDGAAADLIGRLAIKNVVAATISAGSSTYPAAYAWCQDYIRLAAAVRVVEAQAGAGAVPKWWREELKAKQEALDEYGYLALGDATAPSEEANGPRATALEHDLDTADEDLMSDFTPVFRKSDKL